MKKKGEERPCLVGARRMEECRREKGYPVLVVERMKEEWRRETLIACMLQGGGVE